MSALEVRPEHGEHVSLVESLREGLLQALKKSKVLSKLKPTLKPEAGMAALQRSGLDYLILETAARVKTEGRAVVSTADVRRHLDRMGDLIRSGAVRADDVKNGIRTFDVVAQVYAQVITEFPFVYDGKARDLLTSYAQALHR